MSAVPPPPSTTALALVAFVGVLIRRGGFFDRSAAPAVWASASALHSLPFRTGVMCVCGGPGRRRVCAHAPADPRGARNDVRHQPLRPLPADRRATARVDGRSSLPRRQRGVRGAQLSLLTVCRGFWGLRLHKLVRAGAACELSPSLPAIPCPFCAPLSCSRALQAHRFSAVRFDGAC